MNPNSAPRNRAGLSAGLRSAGKALADGIRILLRTERKNILLIRHFAFGDVLFTTPFVRLLREQNPEASVDLYSLAGQACDPAVGYRTCYSISEVAPRTVLRKGHGRVYWFYYEHAPTLHILDGFELSTGLKLKDRTLAWRVSAEEQQRARALLDGHPEPFVGLSLLCEHRLRSLAPVQIQGIIDEIRGRFGGTVVLTATQPLDAERCCNLSGKLGSLRELGAVVACCRAWVAVDSGPFHIAQALGIPTVGIFGCTLPELRVTRPETVQIVRNEALSCLGCYHSIAPGAEEFPDCARKDIACMSGLRPLQIVEALDRVLKGQPDPALRQRIMAYEAYREQHLRQLPGDYETTVIARYQRRIISYQKASAWKRFRRKLSFWKRR